MRDVDSRPLWWATVVLARLLSVVTRESRWTFRAGYARERLGHLDAARSAYERAIADPARPVDWFRRLADLHRRLDDWERVVEVYRQALEAAPQRQDFHLEAAGALERLSRWNEASDHYRAAAEIGDLGLDLHLRWGDACTKGGDRRSALATYEAALEQWPDSDELAERMGHAQHVLGDLDAAMRSYRYALEAGKDQASPTVRLRIAQLLHSAGFWAEARGWLLENIDHHPDHAPTSRYLARVLVEMMTWRGYFEGSVAAPTEARFRPLRLEDPWSRPSDEDVDAGPLSEACLAMERAVVLSPSRPNWLGELAEMRERIGYDAGAIVAYERALERARETRQIETLKSINRWEYQVERLRHEAGQGRFHDPLFDCMATPVEAAAEGDAPGVYVAEIGFAGLNVRGLVLRREVETVEIRLDGLLLRAVTPGEEGFQRRFGFRIRRETLARFPREGRLTVCTPEGEPLLAAGWAREVALRLPHAQDRITSDLERGDVLDKKGYARPDPLELARRQDSYVELYERARDFFEDQFGRQVFLMYGTLLGVHRDGDFIPGDDDFDAGYVSGEGSPEAVKEETKDIIVRLVEAGFTVSVNRRGRMFRLHHEDVDGGRLHLDLRPLWFEDGNLWVHNHVSYPSDVGDFLPVERGTLRRATVYLPRRTEDFLRAHYGPTWKVPDPSFTYHPEDVDPRVRAHLERALLTPSESRELKRYLESSQGTRPGMGRFVSLAEQPLYPLDEHLT